MRSAGRWKAGDRSGGVCWSCAGTVLRLFAQCGRKGYAIDNQIKMAPGTVRRRTCPLSTVWAGTTAQITSKLAWAGLGELIVVIITPSGSCHRVVRNGFPYESMWALVSGRPPKPAHGAAGGLGESQGAEVTASDISASMAQEAERRYKAAAAQPGASTPAAAPKFVASDLESQGGHFHTVACLDVMIHYPQVRTLQCRSQPS